MIMCRMAVVFAVSVAVSFSGKVLLGQTGPSFETIATITAAVDEQIAAVVPGPMLQTAKATYLEGYGLVVTLEVALELPRNPFTGLRPLDEIRRSSQRRHVALKELVLGMLRQYPPQVRDLGMDDRFAVIVYLLNTNPVALPDLPTQFVASVTKRDAMDLRSAAISDADFAQRILTQEY